jgi:hypothetical protein
MTYEGQLQLLSWVGVLDDKVPKRLSDAMSSTIL